MGVQRQVASTVYDNVAQKVLEPRARKEISLEPRQITKNVARTVIDQVPVTTLEEQVSLKRNPQALISLGGARSSGLLLGGSRLGGAKLLGGSRLGKSYGYGKRSGYGYKW